MRVVRYAVGLAALVACSSESSSGLRDGGHDDASATDAGSDVVVPTTDGGTDATPDAGVTGPLFLFVGSGDGKIRVYDVDPDSGTVALKKESSAGTNPSFLAFDPSRRRVVATDEIGGMGQVRSFAFDPTTGALTEINAKAAGGAGTTHLSLDPSGKWIVVANYAAGNMSILPLDANGTIGDATDTKTSGAKSHWAGFDAAGAHVLVTSLDGNVVQQYALDGSKLQDNGSADLPANAGPRHLAFHPTKPWAYVVNETATTVTAFDFDGTSGKLTRKDTISALPAGQDPSGVTGAEIAVHPSGKHVYASTRGFDSIAHFTVASAGGALTLIANTPTGAHEPRSFGMSPEGSLLYAGNQTAGQVVGFRIDQATGALTSLGSPVAVPSPTFVGLARMP